MNGRRSRAFCAHAGLAVNNGGYCRAQAKNFKGLPVCGYTHENVDTDIRDLGFGVVHESRMYIDMCKLVAGHDDPSVSIMAPLVCGPNFKPEYEVRGADTTGELTQAVVLQLVRCGLTPGIDLVRIRARPRAVLVEPPP